MYEPPVPVKVIEIPNETINNLIAICKSSTQEVAEMQVRNILISVIAETKRACMELLQEVPKKTLMFDTVMPMVIEMIENQVVVQP